MSADNMIVVKHIGNFWWVYYGSASTPPTDDDIMENGEGYATRETAVVFAHDLERKIGYVEYGVSERQEP